MKKLKLHSPDLVAQNIQGIAELFPNCVTEAQAENGTIQRRIDFDLLRQELSEQIVEGARERYQLNWPGQRDAILIANAPIAKTLRPCREESVKFDSTQNLFIEGDNLEALKLLQETYLGKVKMIYIDPPYNTGGDLIYDDDFVESTQEYLKKSGQRDESGNRMFLNSDSSGRYHSEWLSMMYPRLKLAKDFLTDDGLIVISIDENEHVNLRRLCDQIFGASNFAGEIVWKNSSKNDQNYISMQHEYLVVYVRDKGSNAGQWKEKKAGLDDIYAAFERFRRQHGTNWQAIHDEAREWYSQFAESNPIYGNKHYSWMDERGIYFPDNISGPNHGQYVYDVLHPVTQQVCKAPASGWRYPKDTMDVRIREGRVHFGEDHTTVPNNKTYLKDTEFQSLTSMRFVDGRAASKRLDALFGMKVFTNPKDELLLKDLMKAFGVGGEDIVMDFFAGSGTTGHAVHELNVEQLSACRFILVQFSESLESMLSRATGSAKRVLANAISFLRERDRPLTIAEIAKERLRRCGEQVVSRSAAPLLHSIDVGFRVLRVDTSNMTNVYYTPKSVNQGDLFAHVDNIKEDRKPEDLLFQVLLDTGTDLTLPISSETVHGKKVFFINEDVLAACFETGISEAIVNEIAARRPLQAVFRDSGFDSDSTKINVEQIFKLKSPRTELKVI